MMQMTFFNCWTVDGRGNNIVAGCDRQCYISSILLLLSPAWYVVMMFCILCAGGSYRLQCLF
jgi:hypothetical protein